MSSGPYTLPALPPLTDEYGQPLATPQDWAQNYTPPGIETPLSPVRPNTTQTPSTGPTLGDTLSMLNPLTYFSNPLNNPMVQKMQGQTANQPQLLTDIETWLQSETAGWVAIGVGLVLIAGAVFGFKNITDTVTGTVREGAHAAALAAV